MAGDADHAEAATFLDQRHRDQAIAAADQARDLEQALGHTGIVRDVPIDQRTPCLEHPLDGRAGQRLRWGGAQALQQLVGFSRGCVEGQGQSTQPEVLHVHHAVFADQADAAARRVIDQLLALVEDGIEHRGSVAHRSADHAQHVGRGLLQLQRLLRLVEQPHVLDCDHRLVSEGLQQLDDVWRKVARRLARHVDQADGLALVQQRHAEHAAVAAAAGHLTPFVAQAGFGLGVGDDLRRSAARRCGQVGGRHRHRTALAQRLCAGLVGGSERGQVQHVLLHLPGSGRIAAHQAPRAVHDGVEHRLHVRRRAGDHLQDLGGGGLSLQRRLGLRQVLGLLRQLCFAGFGQLLVDGAGALPIDQGRHQCEEGEA